MFEKAQWICSSLESVDVCPVFRKFFSLGKTIEKAILYASALGVYDLRLNGEKVGRQVLAPGWTCYDCRIQYQKYDVTRLVKTDNTLEAIVAKGWYSSPMPGWENSEDKIARMRRHTGLIVQLDISFADGTDLSLVSDSTWTWSESPLRFAEIYDGEVYDASFSSYDWKPAAVFDGPTELLFSQEGEDICEVGRVAAREIFVTPDGERVVDFGQNVTGYFEFTVDAEEKTRLRVTCAETLDSKGNFYNGNYRSAKAELVYIAKKCRQTFHPILTYYGFRYIRIEGFDPSCRAEDFTAIVVSSDLKRTGSISCGVPDVNRLFSNVIWGQIGNFLDVPTDCPQRDERLGWTGDAQVFCKAATYNFDTERFFIKWLKDLALSQRPDGAVPQVVPDYLPGGEPSAAWGDAATVCPWQVFQTYGDRTVLENQFPSMCRWVDYIASTTKRKNLWIGGTHFGDWLGLDASEGSYKGASRDDFIASAFYAHSVRLVVKAGKVLGKDVSGYERLYGGITKAFRDEFKECLTQTEYVLAIGFDLAEDRKKAASELAAMIERDGLSMKTGFVGTAYLLHVLSDCGYDDLAYTLLLRREYPSWLYPITKGATTIWEHWDGIKPDGSFWSASMNSFNHYAYGSVVDWIYEKAAGIGHSEDCPGFSKALIKPRPDKRLGWLSVTLETRNGRIVSSWKYTGTGVRYDISVGMPAEVTIGEKVYEVGPGTYVFWS